MFQVHRQAAGSQKPAYRLILRQQRYFHSGVSAVCATRYGATPSSRPLEVLWV